MGLPKYIFLIPVPAIPKKLSTFFLEDDKMRQEERQEILKERKGFGKIEQVFSVDPSKGPSTELSLEEVELPRSQAL